MFFYKQNYHATSALCSFQLLKAWASALQACTHTHTHTFFSPSRAAAAVTARLVPALVRPLRPLAPKPGFSKPLLKPLPVYKQGQTERQAWLAGMYSCFAFPSLTCFSKLAEQKMLTFCSSWSWPLWPPSGSAPSSPPLLVEELRGKHPFFKLACRPSAVVCFFLESLLLTFSKVWSSSP